MLIPVHNVPESLACFGCDCDSPDSIEAALEEGWTDIQYDDGWGWNYIGTCPTCQDQAREGEREYALRMYRKMKHLKKKGWRPVEIIDYNGNELWVDPVGGRFSEFVYADLIQEHRDNKKMSEEKLKDITERIYEQMSDHVNTFIRKYSRKLKKVS